MSNRILCVFHDDTDPSMTIYGEWAHCWVCGAHVPTSELKLIGQVATPKQDPTNVPERMKYILNLPKKSIRGFNLHYDEFGYYLLWPNGGYYKRRNWTGKNRYTSPSGIKPPLFAYPNLYKHLVVVEGEFNAMSLYFSTCGDYTVVSPGSASDFMRHIKYFSQFEKITLILDKDAAGIVHGCQVKDMLLKKGRDVRLVLLDQDFNDIMSAKGEDEVKKVFEANI